MRIMSQVISSTADYTVRGSTRLCYNEKLSMEAATCGAKAGIVYVGVHISIMHATLRNK